MSISTLRSLWLPWFPWSRSWSQFWSWFWSWFLTPFADTHEHALGGIFSIRASDPAPSIKDVANKYIEKTKDSPPVTFDEAKRIMEQCIQEAVSPASADSPTSNQEKVRGWVEPWVKLMFGSTFSPRKKDFSEVGAALNILASNPYLIDYEMKMDRKRVGVIQEMKEYLGRIGYTPSKLNRLKAIHIAGSAGKGSTAAFCSSLLENMAPQLRVGMYTSPSLVSVRETIQIDGKCLTEEAFAKYFWEVWDKLAKEKKRSNSWTLVMPSYFCFLTLLAFHIFLSEEVDATILEVGCGGQYDPTNIIPRPVVTGVTTLDLTHVDDLGPTISDIAFHKGSIFKPGVPAFSVNQEDSAGQDTLKKLARENLAGSWNVIREVEGLNGITLGLDGEHQRLNASLAIALVRTFLSTYTNPTNSAALITIDPPELPLALVSPTPLPDNVKKGLVKAKCAGRCQIEWDDKKDEGVRWWLDAAHSPKGAERAGKWWEGKKKMRRDGVKTVLIFGCIYAHSVKELRDKLVGEPPRLQFDEWISFEKIHCGKPDKLTSTNDVNPAKIKLKKTVKDAVVYVRGMGDVEVFVAGSPLLVGDVMKEAKGKIFLQKDPEEK